MAAVCVFCASSTRLDARWLDLASEVGRELGKRGHTLVSGGGCVGMMGSVADGARDGGAFTLGVMPEALMALEVADRDADELLVTADLASRKVLMTERSDAFLILPGGIGTLDELFEVWTTASLGVHDKPVVILDIDGFYAGLLGWLEGLAGQGFISARAMSAIRVVRTVGDALDSVGPVG